MKSDYTGYGFTNAELAEIDGFCEESDDRVTGLYIEAERRLFRDEFWHYLKANGNDPYSF